MLLSSLSDWPLVVFLALKLLFTVVLVFMNLTYVFCLLFLQSYRRFFFSSVSCDSSYCMSAIRLKLPPDYEFETVAILLSHSMILYISPPRLSKTQTTHLRTYTHIFYSHLQQHPHCVSEGIIKIIKKKLGPFLKALISFVQFLFFFFSNRPPFNQKKKKSAFAAISTSLLITY